MLDFDSLKKVEPRDIWFREAQHFTPWLAENLSCLSESLNLELAFEAR